MCYRYRIRPSETTELSVSHEIFCILQSQELKGTMSRRFHSFF